MRIFLYTKTNIRLDKLKVYELLIYHDVVEIQAGDTPLSPNSSTTNKNQKELLAADILKKQLPKEQSEKFYNLFLEFEKRDCVESKFANAVDKFEPIIHMLDYKEKWKGWSKEFLIKSKEPYFIDFPEINKIFHKLLVYLEENNYFNQ